MKPRYVLLTTAALLALAAPMAGCSTTPAGPTSMPDMSFSQMQPVELNVSAVRVVDSSGNTPTNPRVSPVDALTRYANRRLQAVGGEGALNFVIQQASLTAADAQPSGQWTDAFQISKPVEYTVTMRVGLDLTGRSTQANIRSAYTLERKRQLPADVSLAERDRQLNALIADMVHMVDDAVIAGLKNNMHVVVTPGPITFGKPAPIDSAPAPVAAKAAVVTPAKAAATTGTTTLPRPPAVTAAPKD